jgi:glycosyltransferase involved in cell wall biosynthesis
MKGLFLTLLNLESSPGYSEKIYGQVDAFRDAGILMDIISLGTANSIVINRNAENRNRTFEKMGNFESKLAGNRRALLINALKHIKSADIDFIYLRYPISDPLYILFLKKIRSLSPRKIIFAEIPTFPYDHLIEFNNTKKARILLAVDRVCNKYLKRYLDKIISIDFNGDIFGVKTISIQNGIDIRNYAPVAMPREFFSVLRLIGVANLMEYHGFDRIISMIKKEVDKPTQTLKIEFHIVGPVTFALDKIIKDVDKSGLSEYVFFHGKKSGEELDLLFNKSHLAVGCLAWHRAGLEQASNLKAREYMARGIPFIYSGRDLIIANNKIHALEVPLGDEAIDLRSIINFAVKEQGLEAQLLGIVVRNEKAELEEDKDRLVLSIAANKNKLIELEDQILK